MQQVLFYIPLKADWLPPGFPLYLFLLVVGLGLGSISWLISQRIQRPPLREGLRGAARWLAGAGVVSAIAVYLLGVRFGVERLPIYGFGMMLFLAFIICTGLAGRRGEREGVAHEHIQDLAIWLFIGGLIGARFTSLRFEKGLGLFEMIQEFYKIWDGGIVLYGSVIGALVGYGVAYMLGFRKHKYPTLKLADIVAPSIAVGLCLGRFGCFLNGCCYGQVACPTCPVYAVHFPLSAPAREGLVDQGYQTPAGFTLAEAKKQPRDYGVLVDRVAPQSLAYDAGLRDGDLIVKVNDCSVEEKTIEENGRVEHIPPTRALDHCLVYNWPRGEKQLRLTVKHAGANVEEELPPFMPRTLGLHPTQLYEVVSMFLMFLVLTAYYPLRRHDGQVIAVLMVGYGIHRYLNELLRDDPRPKGFESYTSVILVVAGMALWLYLQTRPAQYRTEAKAGAAEAAAAKKT
jgi:phosphatidylglycerol:prolipoprotein diacylglycerol transferase